jgi:hypothetical protein
MTNKYERLVKGMFTEWFALELRKIAEGSKPTPDFDVFAAGRHVAVLEVKALESTPPVVALDEIADGNLIEGAPGVDNCASRVATKIHEAGRQLEGAHLPRILVLLNDGSEADSSDLWETLRGFLTTEDGVKFWTLSPTVRCRMADDRSKIDLYVWVDKDSGEGPRLVPFSAVGRKLRSEYFASPAEYFASPV